MQALLKIEFDVAVVSGLVHALCSGRYSLRAAFPSEVRPCSCMGPENEGTPLQ